MDRNRPSPYQRFLEQVGMIPSPAASPTGQGFMDRMATRFAQNTRPSPFAGIPTKQPGISPAGLTSGMPPQARPPGITPGITPGQLVNSMPPQAQPSGISPARLIGNMPPQATLPAPMARNNGITPAGLVDRMPQQSMPQAPMARQPGINPAGKPYGCPDGMFLAMEANGSGYHVCQDSATGQQFQVVYR